jgi:opacity protein-like surface antigen
MQRLVCVMFLLANMMYAAQAGSPGNTWYIEGSAGALWRFDATDSSATFQNSLGTTGPGTNTATYDLGPVVNLGIGYRLTSLFRVEIEGSYGRYNFNTISPLSTNGAFPNLNGSALALQSGGLHQEYSGTFNAFYDLPLSEWIAPYIGAGIGGETTKLQTTVFTGPGTRFTENGQSSSATLVMAEVGTTITLDDKWAVVPSYRFEKALTSSGSFSNNINIFKLGLRYSLQ